VHGSGHFRIAVMEVAIQAGNKSAATHLSARLNDCRKKFESEKSKFIHSKSVYDGSIWKSDS
jgi:hypothetical protein